MEPVKWNDAGAALLSYCCCGGEPMTDQEYGEFVRLPTVIALSQRPVTKNEFKTNMQICQEGIRPDNIALRKATFGSMLGYLKFKINTNMDIEKAKKVSGLISSLSSTEFYATSEQKMIDYHMTEASVHNQKLAILNIEIENIKREIADLN